MNISDILRKCWKVLHLNERRCTACLTPFVPSLHPQPFCLQCMDELLSPCKACMLCGCRLKSASSALCRRCLQKSPPWSSFMMLGSYEGALRDAVLRAKFHSDNALLDSLAILLAHKIHPAENTWLVPMPLHPKRLRERGFNQCQELGRRLSKELRIPLAPHFLTKVHDTPSQRNFSKKERIANVKNVFDASPNVAGKRILLLDDVMTTGATVREAAKRLKQAGAEEISLAVLCRNQVPPAKPEA